MAWFLALSKGGKSAYGVDHLVDCWDPRILEYVCEWKGYALSGYPPDRRVKQLESLVGDDRRNCRAPPALIGVFLNNKQPRGTRDRRQHRLRVQWNQATQIDHFDRDVLAGQLLCGRQRSRHR